MPRLRFASTSATSRLSLPARLPAGRTAFTRENRGAELHEVRFLRLAAPHTVDDFVTWQKSGRPIPVWLVPSGGVWHVRNSGSEPHQALVVKLPDGTNEYQERGWFDHGSLGVRPGRPVGGVIDVQPDSDAWFGVDLTPGRYLLLCAALEETGRHYDLGMIYRFARSNDACGRGI
jgi:hypothetical protein